MIRKGSEIVNRERRVISDQRGHSKKKKKKRSLGGKRRFFVDQSSRLLGLVFCLMI